MAFIYIMAKCEIISIMLSLSCSNIMITVDGISDDDAKTQSNTVHVTTTTPGDDLVFSTTSGYHKVVLVG